MRSTISQALREMRRLHDTDAGRLRGVSLRYRFGMPRQGLSATPQPWRDRVQAGIEARESGLITGDTPEYLVLSDGVVVVLLTVAARVVLPDYPLTPLQARHQAAAAEALADLNRYTLADLADHAATHHDHGADSRQLGVEEWDPPPGWLRVAPTSDPTLTTWIDLNPDLPTARDELARVCRTDPDRVLVIDANGYGTYGRNRRRHCLDVLCAMRQIAATHHVGLQVVGDWLDAEGATDTDDLNPGVLVQEFAAAYLGPYPCQADYVQARMTELGWTQALHAAGIPDRYLDTAAITRDWFAYQVRAITAATSTDVGGHVEVFARHEHP
jgi:hypothetical protein